jgi:hypothetical protein
MEEPNVIYRYRYVSNTFGYGRTAFAQIKDIP